MLVHRQRSCLRVAVALTLAVAPSAVGCASETAATPCDRASELATRCYGTPAGDFFAACGPDAAAAAEATISDLEGLDCSSGPDGKGDGVGLDLGPELAALRTAEARIRAGADFPEFLPEVCPNPSSLELEAIESGQIDEALPATPVEGSGVPEAIQGLWWMRGNPVADEVMSFGGSVWDAENRRTYVCVYGAGIWSWHDNLLGRQGYGFASDRRLTYEVQFNDDLTSAEIVPIITVLGRQVRVPNWVARFSMRRESDDIWVRESTAGPIPLGDYTFTRIVSPDGSRLPVFDEYEQELQDEHPTLLIAAPR